MNEKQMRILASWLAADKSVNMETAKQVVLAASQNDLQWKQLLDQLNAPHLKRLTNRLRPDSQTLTPLALTHLHFVDQHVLWQDRQIGRTQLFYKATLPHETQARIAYDIFYDRFVYFLSQRYHIVVLSQSDYHLELFLPAHTPDFNQLWSEYVAEAFSAATLRRSFASLVSTIKLTERGFSALSVPIISQDQALYLAAFYLANLNSLLKGDEKRRREIAEEQQKLAEAQNDRDRQRTEKNIARLQKELSTRLERYQPFYDLIARYDQQHPVAMDRVRQLAAAEFSGTAGIQIAKSAGKIGKCIRDMEKLLTIHDLHTLPPLITARPLPTEGREGGDSSSKLCYGCGRLLQRGDPAYSANKFIFESPSQRLQSAAGQSQPKICSACAALSFLSPIKMGSGRLVVRMKPMKEAGENGYLVEDRLRAFIMGELGIIAGKYAILRAHEEVSGKLVADQLGGAQYALYKTAISFPPLVFEQYQIEALVDNMALSLPGRQLAVLHRLSQIFFLQKSRWDDKGQFAAFGRAIRHVQQDEPVFAIYELMTSGLVSGDLFADRARQLEELRSEHVRLTMNENRTIAEQYQDIAAMTGLLYPFCTAVNNALKGDPAKQRIEVRKVIERVDDPFELLYTVAPHISSEREDGQYDFYAIRTRLYNNPDTYFSFARLKKLLSKLPDRPGELQDEEANYLTITLDDVYSVFTHLYEKHYATEKARREFSYKLKLSLAARFPKHYEKKDSDKE